MHFKIGDDVRFRSARWGNTKSDDFPTSTGAYDTSFNGGTHDAFGARLPVGATTQHWVYLPIVVRKN